MKTIYRRRLYFIFMSIISIFATVGLILYAMKKSVSLYFTPEQLTDHEIKGHQQIHIGGEVMANSIHPTKKDHGIRFSIGDYRHSIWVEYHGVLPGLFHIRQMVVVRGQFDIQGVFQANQVLAKHDEVYRPLVKEK